MHSLREESQSEAGLATDDLQETWRILDPEERLEAFLDLPRAEAADFLAGGKRVHIEGRAPGPDAELQVQDFRFVGRMLAAPFFAVKLPDFFMADQLVSQLQGISDLLYTVRIGFPGLDSCKRVEQAR